MNGAPPRSTFVTVIAWLFIVLSGGTTLIGILQNVMIWFLFPRNEFRNAMSSPAAVKEVPAAFRLIFGNMELLFLAVLLLSALTFVSSLALLRRREWARVVFIVLMLLGIVWNIAAPVAQLVLFNDARFNPPSDPNFRTMMIVMQVFTWVFALAVAALFAWIAKKLMSPEIRAEFV